MAPNFRLNPSGLLLSTGGLARAERRWAVTNATGAPRSVKTIRWIARVWSIIVAASVLLMFVREMA